MDSVDGLRGLLREFAEARDWQRFHTPRNLALALAGEVGELVAELQWVSDEELAERLRDAALFERLSDEAADVLIYLVRFADVCGIDLLAAAEAKIARNEHRYPAGLSRGSAAKYTELGTDDHS
ncbi:nucleotide pyrophosphohydrolase [Saccharopolyspora shandongensis]|uniref:nucleotide pyrophosphohydrolase n=1 Tax=Saccharopolyspora shandongensis TaxID=418495 RepID=UPI00342518AB